MDLSLHKTHFSVTFSLMKGFQWSIVVFALFLAVSCGGENTAPGPDAEDSEWSELIAGSWSIPNSSETYKCVRKTLSEDQYITGIRPIAPNGTHHTVLTIGPASGPDGIVDCNPAVNADMMLFGSGVGTGDLLLPDGVAFKAEKGQQLLLNLHLFNVTGAPLSGTSGIEVSTTTPDAITHLGESILGGPVNFQINPGEQTIVGGCRMNGDVTVLALMPHMHQLGTHMKVTAELPGGDQILLDKSYSFDDQAIVPLDTPLELDSGTRLRVECTYNNTTEEVVSFGEGGTNDEMCFAGIFRYPAFGGDFGIICSG